MRRPSLYQTAQVVSPEFDRQVRAGYNWACESDRRAGDGHLDAGTNGAPVLLVATDPNPVRDGELAPRVRILVNDEPVYEGRRAHPSRRLGRGACA